MTHAIRTAGNFGPIARFRSAFAAITQAARQHGPKLIKLTPAPLRPALAKLHRPFARYLAAGKYRRKYGGRFVSAIDEHDDLMYWESSRIETEAPLTAFRYYRAARGYFGGGEWNAHEVESALSEVGFSLRQADSFLEFACGYGRLTRHFVHMISPSKSTVSDIDQRAVNFVKEKFRVDGFYSTTLAEDLAHDGRYDVIVVVSLFSHLSLQQWGPWLKRLNEMLNPDGLLLFTTHNVNDAGPEGFQAPADGFLYKEHNETRGRLNVEHYGAAYVSNAYVEQAVAENFEGRLLRFYPHALLLAQDAYILQRVDGLN